MKITEEQKRARQLLESMSMHYDSLMADLREFARIRGWELLGHPSLSAAWEGIHGLPCPPIIKKMAVAAFDAEGLITSRKNSLPEAMTRNKVSSVIGYSSSGGVVSNLLTQYDDGLSPKDSSVAGSAKQQAASVIAREQARHARHTPRKTGYGPDDQVPTATQIPYWMQQVLDVLARRWKVNRSDVIRTAIILMIKKDRHLWCDEVEEGDWG